MKSDSGHGPVSSFNLIKQHRCPRPHDMARFEIEMPLFETKTLKLGELMKEVKLRGRFERGQMVAGFFSPLPFLIRPFAI